MAWVASGGGGRGLGATAQLARHEVSRTVWLPADVLIPRSLRDGLYPARMIAIASSCPA